MRHAATVGRWCPLVPVACATVCTLGGLAASGPALEVWADDRPPAETATAAPDNEIQLAVFRAESAPQRTPEQFLDDTVRVIEKGSSMPAARRAALAALPLARMTETHRQRAHQVLDAVSLFRELPAVEFDVDPACCRFFTAHPDVAASIWRVMKISRFQMWQTERDRYEADAGDGTVGVIDVLLRSADENVILCEGTYSSPLLTKSIKAIALFHLRTRCGKTADGHDVVQGRLSMFVAFPSQAIEAAARIVSPLSNMIIDRNFREVCLFVAMMSQAMQRQPGWVEQVADRMDGVPEVRKTQLVETTMKVYVAARERELSTAGATPPTRTAARPPQ